MPNFALIEDRGKNQSLINIDQIRMITDIRDGHCNILFANQFTVEITGEGADQFIGNLLLNAKMLDGTPMLEAIEKYKRSKEASSSTSESQT
jgi:hypothetical protein